MKKQELLDKLAELENKYIALESKKTGEMSRYEIEDAVRALDLPRGMKAREEQIEAAAAFNQAGLDNQTRDIDNLIAHRQSILDYQNIDVKDMVAHRKSFLDNQINHCKNMEQIYIKGFSDIANAISKLKLLKGE